MIYFSLSTRSLFHASVALLATLSWCRDADSQDREAIAKRALKRNKLHVVNKLQVGSLLPGAVKEVPDPASESCRASGGSCDAEDNGASWFGLIYGLPVLLARAPAKLQALLPSLKKWLLEDREPKWRKLPPNLAWPADRQEQLTAKYRYYNALEETLTAKKRPPDVKTAASMLKEMLISRWLELVRRFPSAVATMEPASERAIWERAILPIGNMSYHPRGPFPVGVHVQSWMNAHRSSEEGERDLTMHNHHFGWHGYFLIDSEPSNTTYAQPPLKSTGKGFEQVLFSLNNSNGVLVLLCGGTDHAVPAGHRFDGKHPRVSMPFDILYTTKLNGIPVSHPALNGLDEQGNPLSGSVQELQDSENKWMRLLSPSELQKRLAGQPALAFAHKSLEQRYEDAKSGKLHSRWGGVVQLADLV